MFDNFYTKFEGKKIRITDITADYVIKEIEKKLKKSKRKDELYAHLSKAYFMLKQFDKAIKYAKKSLKENPNYDYAKMRVGIAYAKLGKKEKCIDWIEKIKKENQKDYLLSILKMLSFDYLDMKTEFLEECKNYKKLNIKNNDYYNRFLLHLYIIEKNKKKENETFEIIKNRNLGLAYCIKGDIYFAEKKYELALKNYLLAEKQGYKSINLYTTKSKIYEKLGNKNDLIKNINKAIKLSPKNGYLYYLKGYYYKLNKEMKKAIECFHKAEFNGLKATELYKQIAHCYSDENKYEESNKYIIKGLKENPKNAYLHYLKGYNLKELEKFKKSLKHYLLAKKYNYDKNTIYKELAYIYSCPEVTNYEKSNRYINKALKTNPNEGYLYYLKGFNFNNLGYSKKALKYLKKSQELGFKEDFLFEEIAKIYFQEKKLKEAIEYINKIEFKTNYIKYMNLSILLEKKVFDKAIEELKLIENNAKDIVDYNWLTIIYTQIGEYKTAEEYIKKSKDSRFYTIKNIKSWILVKEQIIEYYKNNYKNLIKLYKNNKKSLINEDKEKSYELLTDSHTKLNEYKKAKYYLNKIKKSNNKNKIIPFLKGNIYYKMINFEKALKNYKIANKSRLLNKELFENLITIYQSRNDNKSVDKYRKKLEKLIKEEETLKELKDKYLNI